MRIEIDTDTDPELLAYDAGSPILVRVNNHQGTVKRYERIVWILKVKIDALNAAIADLQKQCPNHTLEFQKDAGEHQMACKSCGIVY